MWTISVFLVLVLYAKTNNGFFRHTLKIEQFNPPRDSGDPLLLTPLIKGGHVILAQHLSKVNPEIGNLTSYAGFFTVNKYCNSNLFFWFFPAQKSSWEDAPLLLWLQGEPGATSMYGLFEELGPFKVTETGLEKRKYSWNVQNNVIFIDQPVGSGFSYTKDCYPTNGNEVGEDLYEAIVQFYELFPKLNKNKFYISGESYAGHYIPAIGHTIHNKNPSAKVKINLAAMIIGNGWVDPTMQNNYGEYLYQLGLVDYNQRDIMKEADGLCKNSIQDNDVYNSLYFCHMSLGKYFNKFVGDVSVYNYLQSSSEEISYWERYIQTSNARRSLHVGSLTFQAGDKIFESLEKDSFQTVKPWLEELLEVYPIVFFNGQLDIVSAYPMSSKVMNSLNWSGQNIFLNSTRSKWCVNEKQAGYIKGQHRLYDVLVRGAGHMVPKDQPHWAYTLINSITSSPSDNPLHALTVCEEEDS